MLAKPYWMGGGCGGGSKGHNAGCPADLERARFGNRAFFNINRTLQVRNRHAPATPSDVNERRHLRQTSEHSVSTLRNRVARCVAVGCGALRPVATRCCSVWRRVCVCVALRWVWQRCFALCNVALHCVELFCVVWCCIALCCSVAMVFCCFALHFDVLRRAVPCCVALFCIGLYVLRCVVLS